MSVRYPREWLPQDEDLPWLEPMRWPGETSSLKEAEEIGGEEVSVRFVVDLCGNLLVGNLKRCPVSIILQIMMQPAK